MFHMSHQPDAVRNDEGPDIRCNRTSGRIARCAAWGPAVYDPAGPQGGVPTEQPVRTEAITLSVVQHPIDDDSQKKEKQILQTRATLLPKISPAPEKLLPPSPNLHQEPPTDGPIAAPCSTSGRPEGFR